MEKQINNRFEKVEKRIDKIENFMNRGTLSNKGQLLKCSCGYSWVTRSKLELISCPSCGNKVSNKKEEFTCFKCGKTLKKSEAKYGYTKYFCKDCYKRFRKEALKEVGKVTKNL